MVLAAIAGVLVGIVSLIPFPIAAKKGRLLDPSSSLNLLAPLLLTLVVSIAILVVGMIICKTVASDCIFAFVIGEFAMFVIGVIVFGIIVSKRR